MELHEIIHSPDKVAAATYRDFPRISTILKFRAFLQRFPRFLLKSKQNTKIVVPQPVPENDVAVFVL